MPDNSGAGTPTLGEMMFANESAARDAARAAATPAQEPDPIIPSDAAAANARVAEIKADPKWRDKYLSGDKRAAKELRDLEAVVAKEKNVQTEMAVAGELYPGIQPSGHLAAVGTAKYLREAGFGDAEVRHVVGGAKVSPQEHAAAVETKARLMESTKFRDEFLGGDAEAKRTMTRLNAIISSSIQGSAA